MKSEQIEVDIVRVEEPEESGVEASELDARRGATLAVRKILAGSGMRLTVALVKYWHMFLVVEKMKYFSN